MPAYRKITVTIFLLISMSANAAWKKGYIFEKNAGQVRLVHEDANRSVEVKFILRSQQTEYYFSSRGYMVVQHGDAGRTNTTYFDFPQELLASRTGIEPEGEIPSQFRMNYFLNGTQQSAECFERIIYRNLQDGSDLEFRMNGDQLERRFVIRNKVYEYELRFDVSGSDVQPINNDSSSGYRFTNACGTISEELSSEHPYFEISDVRENIEWTMDRIQPVYHLREDIHDPQTVSVITWLTYLGGSSSDEIFSVAVTPDSGAVVAGRTSSFDFPATPGAYCDTFNLNYDVVITRFASNGACMWSTYYGGNDFDGAYGVIRLDTNYVVCGSTNSTSLPMISATQLNNAGSYDGFLAVFSSSGMLLRSTYYGGSGGDQFFAIALDTSRRLCVAGSSSSNNYPNTSGHYQPALAGAIDATLTVFDQQLNPAWATYYGGSNSEDIHSITTSPNGEIIVAGGTYSVNFPVTANAYQSGMFSIPDCYLVKFGMDGSRHYATFFGGSNNEDCNAVAADSSGNVYLTGFTFSIDFPVMGNTFQSNHAAQSDVFVSKFDSAGQMEWSTFIGGAGVENGLAIERRGKYIYIAGNTESVTFPVSANAIQASNAGTSDGFVIKMDTAGNMVSGTFMGGNGVDALYGVGVTDDTCVITCGTTYSTNLAIQNPYQSTNMTQGDGYVVKFGMSEQNLGNGTPEPNSTYVPDVLLYPNPTSQLLYIGPDGTFIRIFDTNGKIVKEQPGTFSSEAVDVRDLAPGQYCIVIYGSGGMIGGFPFIKN